MSGLLAGATVGALCGVLVGATVSAAMRKQDPYSLPGPVTEGDVERLAEALYQHDMAAWEYLPGDTTPFALAEDRETYLRHARVCLGFLTASETNREGSRA